MYFEKNVNKFFHQIVTQGLTALTKRDLDPGPFWGAGPAVQRLVVPN